MDVLADLSTSSATLALVGLWCAVVGLWLTGNGN